VTSVIGQEPTPSITWGLWPKYSARRCLGDSRPPSSPIFGFNFKLSGVYAQGRETLSDK